MPQKQEATAVQARSRQWGLQLTTKALQPQDFLQKRHNHLRNKQAAILAAHSQIRLQQVQQKLARPVLVGGVQRLRMFKYSPQECFSGRLGRSQLVQQMSHRLEPERQRTWGCMLSMSPSARLAGWTSEHRTEWGQE